MKLLSILAASIWVGIAAAQGITIRYPPAGENIHAGQQLTVQVVKNNHILSSIEAGLVIGFLPCADRPSGCSPNDLGSILYNGPYKPKSHESGIPAYQNFTVAIPTDIPTGAAQISIARFFLIGAGPSPTLGGAAVTVNVA